MKRVILLIFALAFAFSLCACEQPLSDEDIAAIYVNPNHALPEPFVDQNAPLERVITVNGIELKLKYRDSLDYGIFGTDDYYITDENGEGVVCISRNGAVESVEYDFGRVEMPDEASAEDVRALIGELLKDLVDISEYQNVQLKESNDREGNPIYIFYANNILQGRYTTESMSAKISEDGRVFYLQIDDLSSDVSGINVNDELVRCVIDCKYQDVYEKKDTKYKSFEFFIDHATFVEIDEEVYVHYAAVAKYKNTSGEYVSGWCDNVFVPLRLISG